MSDGGWVYVAEHELDDPEDLVARIKVEGYSEVPELVSARRQLLECQQKLDEFATEWDRAKERTEAHWYTRLLVRLLRRWS